MKYRLLHDRRGAVLVVKPREATYGHQVLEILMGMHMARARRAAVTYRRPSQVANPAVFSLVSDDVEVLQDGWRGRLARARAAIGDQRDRPATAAGALRARWRQWLLLRLEALGRRTPRARRWRKVYKASFGPKTAAGAPAVSFFGLDFRRCYAREPLRVRLRADVDRRAADAARSLGLDRARLVALHVRESGFKRGEQESPLDRARNARIETYLPAADVLARRGFTVVRIGDPTMTPLAHPAIVDVATSPARTGALELWLLMRSELFIAGDSGPYVISYLTGRPCLAVNVVNVVGGYPIHAHDRYLVKRAFDRRAGRYLTLGEMLTEEYFEHRTDLERYALADNTPDEICEAVEEMLDLIDGRARISQAQRECFDLAHALYNSPIVARRRTRKGEPEHQILGDGFVGRAFADRFLSAAGRCAAG